MKTEMKKNKLVLALAVVAAFAMVSVAGIAVLQSDDSDAAATEGVFSPLVAAPTGPFIINASVTSSYDFYVNEGATFGALVIVVQENVNYNGILRIGVMSADKVYTPYTSIELKNASAVQLTAMAINTDVTGFVSLFEIGNLNKDFGGALPQGDFEVKQGQVMLGSATVDVDQYDWNYFAWGMDNLTDINDFLWYLANGFDYMVDEEKMVSFSGKITAGEFSATANYVAGTYISVDSAGNARVSGVAVSPNEMLPYDTVNSKYPAFEDRTLIFEGKASIQFPEAIQKLLDRNLGDLDVSTAYLSSQLPSIGDILSMTYLPATGSFDLFATDSVNVTVAEGAVITTGDRPATVAASVELKVGTADTVVGAFLIGSDGSSYKADITGLAGDSAVFEFVPFGTYTLIVYNGVGLDLKVWYSTNAVVSESGLTLGSSGLSAPSSDLLPGAEPEYLKYNEADYTFEFAFDTTGYGGLGKLKEAGIIEFSDDVTGQDIFAVLKSKGAGHPLEFFYGNLSNEAAGTLTATALATVPSGSIKAGDVASAGAISAYVSLDAPSRPAKITVMGEMNFIYTSDDVQGLMVIGQSDSKLTFEGTGIVSQGVKPTQTVPPRGIEESVNLVAARYFVNEPATGTVKEKTYYYTTLNNAITKNNVITLLGDHVILVDTTLDNSEFDSIEIIIDSSASLSVGRDDDPDTEEDESASPILTVPAKTTLVALSGADYEVVSGQAVYDVKPAASDEPESDILIEGNKFIYTDLATALDISVSGDVLELLRFADLKRNATLKSGVELNDDYGINIPEEITLTVDGTFTSTGDSLIEGTVRILGTATFTDSSYAEFGPSGAIDIASSGTLTV
ncbi:MAG: hypothetical protein LBU30_03375, partial [Candidatus Methanoplasma sp.]|nr:hypothetical protein [Candidatus Methanoplasma sp.]